MSNNSKRGGARPGAGRKLGSKNRRTLASEALLGSESAKGLTPLEFGLKVLRGEQIVMREIDGETGRLIDKTYLPTFADRRWAAEMTAPFMHPKLANIEHTGNVAIHHEDFIARLMEEDESSSEKWGRANTEAPRRPQ